MPDRGQNTVSDPSPLRWSASLADALARRVQLEELDLRANGLRRFPFDAATFPALRRLDLSYNPLASAGSPPPGLIG